jgi:hypothetical protein
MGVLLNGLKHAETSGFPSKMHTDLSDLHITVIVDNLDSPF